MFKRTKSKEWSKCYRSFMKTKHFILHLFLGTLFINLAILSLRFNNDIIAFILFGINMFLSYYIGSKKMFDKLEIHMNKSGFTLETKSGELEGENNVYRR